MRDTKLGLFLQKRFPDNVVVVGAGATRHEIDIPPGPKNNQTVMVELLTHLEEMPMYSSKSGSNNAEFKMVVRHGKVTDKRKQSVTEGNIMSSFNWKKNDLPPDVEKVEGDSFPLRLDQLRRDINKPDGRRSLLLQSGPREIRPDWPRSDPSTDDYPKSEDLDAFWESRLKGRTA